MYEIHKKDYFLWLFENKTQNYANDVKRVLEELFKTKEINIENIKTIIEQCRYSSKYTSLAIRNFLNYCEEFELLNFELITNFRHKIKLNSSYNIDSYVPTTTKVLSNYDEIKENSQFKVLFLLMYESGCRFTELKDFIINFDKSKIEINDNIILYRNFYFRNKKSSFYLFFTKNTYDLLLKEIEFINFNTLNSFKNKLNRSKTMFSVKYFRKYHFTLMIENNISFEIANFIQGRTSQNIGFNHYLAKKSIALKEYSKIIDKFGCC